MTTGRCSQALVKFRVNFRFADEKLTNKHILDKIEKMIDTSALSIFDITGWNPNVALELGMAYAKELDFYILFDPSKGNTDVLSDVRGIDRIEYQSYAELRAGLVRLMREQFGSPEPPVQESPADSLTSNLASMRSQVPQILEANPGLAIGGIASALGGIPIDIAQTIVRPMVGYELESRGVRRGMTYYVTGTAPPLPEEDVDEPDEQVRPVN